MEELQSWWEVPSVAHFCSLFREAFDLPDFDIEELEEGLLSSGQIQGGDNFLVEQLTLRLMQGYHQRPDVINVANQEKYLFDLIKKKWASEGRNIDVLHDVKFASLSLRTKVEILFSLCDYRLDAADVMDVLKNLESESLRVEPLGKDDSGATYWYFYGTRLYKEAPSAMKSHQHSRRRREKSRCKKDARRKRRKRSSDRRERANHHDYSSDASENENDVHANRDWCIVCSAESDWVQLAEKFRMSRSRTEKELHRCLTEDFLPEIGRIIQDKERNNRKRLLESLPRRVSHRIERLRQQEEDQGGTTTTTASLSDEHGNRKELERRHREKLELSEAKEREERALERLAAREERASRARKRLARNLIPTGDYGSSASSTYSSSSDTEVDVDDSSFSSKRRNVRDATTLGAQNGDAYAGRRARWWGEPHLVLSPQRFPAHVPDPLIGRPTTILQIYPNQVVSVAPTYRTAQRNVASFYGGTIALQRPP